jgi:hypothetical protein
VLRQFFPSEKPPSAASRLLGGGFGMLCNYRCVSILGAAYMILIHLRVM